MTRVLVLRTGQPVNRVHSDYGPFSRLFERGLNADAHVKAAAPPVLVDELDVTTRAAGDPLPALTGYHGVIMTGSPAYVGDNEPWMRWSAGLLAHVLGRDLPLLCVCFGHQLLGQSLGGDVGPNPRGREMGTVVVEISPDADDPLLADLPRRFEAQCTHRDVIRGPSRTLKVVGHAAHDPHHVVRAAPRAWGLQFHPEFDDMVMRLYLEARREAFDEEHGAGSADARLARVRATPVAASILTRFAALCRDEARRQGAVDAG